MFFFVKSWAENSLPQNVEMPVNFEPILQWQMILIPVGSMGLVTGMSTYLEVQDT